MCRLCSSVSTSETVVDDDEEERAGVLSDRRVEGETTGGGVVVVGARMTLSTRFDPLVLYTGDICDR